MTRWSKHQATELPKTAEEYERWFEAQVALYRNNPTKMQLIPPKQTPSAYQLEGLRLLLHGTATSADQARSVSSR